MTLLNRQTPNVLWAGKPPLALMYGGYQVWPDTGPTQWYSVPPAGARTWTKFAKDGLGDGTVLMQPPWDALDAADRMYPVGDAHTGPVPAVQYQNNKDGSLLVTFGPPWSSEFFPGGQNSVYLIPNPQAGPYPIKKVTIGPATFAGAISGIRVEVETDPAKMGTGQLYFSGCPLPFGTLPNEASQGRIGTSNTWYYECFSRGDNFIQEQFFFTPALSFYNLIRRNGGGSLAEFYKLALAYVFPPERKTLFNWPNNFVALADSYCFGDPRQPHHTLTLAGQPYTGLNDIFNYGGGPGNLLRCVFIGPTPSVWPANARDDLFDLSPWQPPPGPGILQVTADTGPDGVGSDSGVVTITAIRGGAAVAVTGASVRIDDMDGDPPVLNWASFGNLRNGDIVTLVFRNEAIAYMGGRTITGTIGPRP